MLLVRTDAWIIDRSMYQILQCENVRFPGLLMATSSLCLDFGMFCQSKSAPEPDIGWFEALSYPVGQKLCWKSQAASGEKGMPPEALQESLWQNFFRHPSQWWDNRRSKLNPRSPDFRHKFLKVGLWLNNQHKPAWVDSQLAKWDAEMNTNLESVESQVPGEDAIARLGQLGDPRKIEMCRTLCEDGRISDAVDALTLLVQEGCRIDKNTYYRVLKGCIAHKDLVMGRRIHALTNRSGYEGEAFLATQLIALYASLGRLEEAMQVFNKVRTPTTYNWATIIFACGRHGEAAQAIRLYRQMLESTSIKPHNRVYVAVLKACAKSGDLVAGKQVHAHILASPEKSDVLIQTGLISMYAKCGSIGDARRVFDRLPERNVVSWTAMLAGYAQKGMGQEALSLYSIMQQEGITTPDSVTFVCVLQACASVGVGALYLGKQLHDQIDERGLQDNAVLGGSLVNMYAKCGSLEDAHRVFDRLPKRNVIAWTAMLAGYSQQGMGQEALSLYSSMQQEGIVTPDSVTYVCLLQACASIGAGARDQGKQLHAQILKQKLQVDLVLGGSLVNMYAQCGSLADARRVFDILPVRNVVAWNSMLGGYAKQMMGQEALRLYSSMQQEGVTTPNSVTFMCLLQACGSVGVGALEQGKQLHAQIQERGMQGDVLLGGSLVNMYVKCGSLDCAHIVFDTLPDRTVVTWTALIAGYAQQGLGQAALNLYNSMRQQGLTTPDTVTFVCLLKACASIGVGALEQGKQLHAEIEEQRLHNHLVLGGSLVSMYAKCNSLGDARRVFDRLPEKDVVVWNAMLAGYAQKGMGQEALSLYSSMQQEGITTPDSVTFVCLLQACASVGVGALDLGKQFHARIKELGLQEDLVLGGSLVNMYAKCGGLGYARQVFDRLAEKNVVAWTAMIGGYAQQGMGEEALTLYTSMQEDDVTPPNSFTFVCLLQAAASVSALSLGKHLHAQIEERGLLSEPVMGAALVNMYAKCGSMFDSRQVFDLLAERSTEAWGALICGYTRQGDSDRVFDLVDKMRLDGVQPDGITLLCMLTVCSHVGQVDKGRKYFEDMTTDYGIRPTVEHYTCMVDLLGRAGHLEEALQLVKSMPFPPTGAVWLTLLGACQKWNNVEIGLLAFEGAVIVDGKDASAHVLMSNIYASADMWEEAKEMHARRRKSGSWKKPGQSWWTDMAGVVHRFAVGERTHSQSDSIFMKAPD